MILNIFGWIMFIFGAYVLLNIILNGIFFRIIGNNPKLSEDELVSVILPARNEEKNIGRVLDSLCRQTYSNMEILVINDQSTDLTQNIIEEFEKKDSRIHGFSSDPSIKLHSKGKINALLQLVPHAQGAYFLALDADTFLEPTCVEYALSILKNRKVDMISGFPKEEYPDFASGSSMCAMLIASSFVPHWLNWFLKLPGLTVAIGQFIFMTKKAYEETGGYSALGDVVCDDIGISRLFARKKKKVVFVDMSAHVHCNMYGSRKEVYDGISRSLSGMFKTDFFTLLILAVLIAFVTILAIAPCVSAFLLIRGEITCSVFLFVTGNIFLWFGWLVSALFAKYGIGVSATYSLTFFHVICMVLKSLFKKITHQKYIWKGREI